jgi:hypothetical protein
MLYRTARKKLSIPHWCDFGGEFGSFQPAGPGRIPILTMNTHRIAVGSFASSLPASRPYGQKSSFQRSSLDDRLDKVFQAAEHVDAKCVHLLDAASQKRRAASR